MGVVLVAVAPILVEEPPRDVHGDDVPLRDRDGRSVRREADGVWYRRPGHFVGGNLFVFNLLLSGSKKHEEGWGRTEGGTYWIMTTENKNK